jgi:hypothetical protein
MLVSIVERSSGSERGGSLASRTRTDHSNCSSRLIISDGSIPQTR